MLTPEDKKQLVQLLKKIENPHEGLSQEVFDALIHLVVYVACELVIVNDRKEFLLTWRDDPYWKGWHFPGGLLRYKESFDERIQRVADDELSVHVDRYEFIGPVNWIDSPRGHIISLIFLCHTPDTPKDGKWFKEVPNDIIPHHSEYWEKVQPSLDKFLKER